jgi:hypothetical protein
LHRSIAEIEINLTNKELRNFQPVKGIVLAPH